MRINPQLILVLLALVSCDGVQDDEEDDTDVLQDGRPTTWYSFNTPDSDTGPGLFLFMSADDVDFIQDDTGVSQAVGKGILYGIVKDRVSGGPLSGIRVTALNDAGVSAGSPVYQHTDGSFNTSLTSTTTKGGFVIQNMLPGRVNLRCLSGASGNAYVSAVVDETTIAELPASTGYVTLALSGYTRGLTNVPTAPEAGVLVTGLATGLPFPFQSDGTTGAFTAGSVPAHNTFLLKLTKTGFVDTYNTLEVGASDTASPEGDLLIVSVATLAGTSFTPASVALNSSNGVIRGSIVPASGGAEGYTVFCLSLSGMSVGSVRYGSAADASPDDGLTASSATGVFYVYNVPPGTVYLSATKAGYGGSTYLDMTANSVHIVGALGTAVNSADTITVTGYVSTFQNSFLEGAEVNLLGVSIVTTTDGDGYFELTGVPSHQRFLVRTAP